MMMNKLIKVLCVLGMVIAAASSASAFGYDQGGLTSGDQEISGMFQTSSRDGGDPTTMLGGGYGIFITDELLVGGDAFLMASAGLTGVSLAGSAKYHFPSNSPALLPYAGVKLGFISLSGTGASSTELLFGFTGGAKYFLAKDVAAAVEGYYDSYNSTSETGVRLLINLFH